MILFLLALPLAAAACIWRKSHPDPTGWRIYAQRIGILFGAGLFAAGPFVSTHGLGTSEAYNYSLAVADAVTQFRAGVIPVLVGQSEYAFNGRIHPLRTAPYLTYFAGGLDFLSFHQLSFWALQNLALALSMIGGVFSMYACLRRGTGVTPKFGLFLAAAYVLGPGVLAPAYGMDLYMTVMTLPFIPLALFSCARALAGERTFGIYALLGAALAATWLAHPPVALWLSVGVVFLQLPALPRLLVRPKELAAVFGAALLGLALAAFAFVSVLTITSYNKITVVRETEVIMDQVQRAFKASLHPVSATAAELGDFQLGYFYWALLAISLGLGAWRRRWTTLLFAFVAIFLLVLTIPVPGLTAWLWGHMPTFAQILTSSWPMQRLYLLATTFVLFAVAGVVTWPRLDRWPRIARDAFSLLVICAVGWTLNESRHFIGRGFASRMDEQQTAAGHRVENIDLTLISYAMLGTPSDFINGVMDPVMEFRILRRADETELVSNWSDKTAIDPASVQKGSFRAGAAEDNVAPLSPALTLKPGARYRLDFAFHTAAPDRSILQAIGTTMHRDYPLPQSGGPHGFGMLPNNNHALTFWTTRSAPETVNLRVVGPGLGDAQFLDFADFTFGRLDVQKLPVVLESLIPLRVRVHSSEPALLETPRLYLDGYVVTVNGQPVPTHLSPDRLLMFPIPPGESSVEVRYVGSPVLRASFWLSFASWLAFLSVGATWILFPTAARAWRRGAASVSRWLERRKIVVVGACIAIAGGLYGWRNWANYREAAGPLRIRLLLPRGETDRSQPLVTTGVPSAGTFIFIIYQDKTHIRVGMDVWGRAYWVSAPLSADYFSEQEFIVSSGALYPPGHPKLKGLSAVELDRLRQRITVEYNGHIVLDQPIFSYESKPSDVTVGESRIGGSNTEPKFVGKILQVERLPINAAP